MTVARLTPTRFSPVQAKLLVALLLGLVIAADYSTGPYVGFITFYLIPVAVATWYINIRWGAAVAILSAVLITTIDVSSRHYPGYGYIVANAGLRLIAFVGVAFLIDKICESRDEQNRLNEQLQSTVAELEHSLQTVLDLQNKVQVICAWTHRIKSEGTWMSFEEFMSRNLHLKFTHGISEQGVQEFMKGRVTAPNAPEPTDGKQG